MRKFIRLLAILVIVLSLADSAWAKSKKKGSSSSSKSKSSSSSSKSSHSSSSSSYNSGSSSYSSGTSYNSGTSTTYYTGGSSTSSYSYGPQPDVAPSTSSSTYSSSTKTSSTKSSSKSSSSKSKSKKKKSKKKNRTTVGYVTIVGSDGMYYRQDVSTCPYKCAIETTDGYHVCGDFDDCNASGLGVWGWIVLCLVIGIFVCVVACMIIRCVKGTKEFVHHELEVKSHSSSD